MSDWSINQHFTCMFRSKEEPDARGGFVGAAAGTVLNGRLLSARWPESAAHEF